MFIAALFTVAKIRKQPKCPSKDEWLRKMLETYILLCHKKNEIYKYKILLFSTMWVDLENIVLSEISQKMIRNSFIHTKKKLVIVRGKSWERREIGEGE